MIQADELVFETEDNFQKQTNRNRMYIYSANGIQMLNIAVQHQNTEHQKYKEIRLEEQSGWQKNHFKSLEAAYKNSPFYDYFIDDLVLIFQKKHTFLLDLNFEIFDTVNSCLGIDLYFSKTTEYFHEVKDTSNFRHLANGKKDTTQTDEYTQVFHEKYGFIPNLSILDLLFNEGRYAVSYLKQQSILIL